MEISNTNLKEELPELLQIEHLIWKQGKKYIAGIDEAGRGPLAGPVVAAAVIFLPYFYLPGVRDSKKLTPLEREKLYPQIIDSAVAVGIGVVSAQEIDRINIRQATFKAMRKALGDLHLQPDYLLFDGYELPEKLYPQEAIIGGDNRSFTIAAASILAKVTRDRMMLEYHQKYPIYRFDKHKGYGTRLHRDLIRQYGPSPIHRKTFLKKILADKNS